MNDKLRIASFNANSIRSRLGIILDWMREQECDVLCVQETKVTDSDFPADAFAEAGLRCAFAGQKSYNGVAIISPHEIEDARVGLGLDSDEEARIIRAKVKGVNVVNTYIPQGTSPDSPRFLYKLDWIRGMRDYFDGGFSPSDPVVWVGDFNVAREPIDVYDPEALLGSCCYHPEEHRALDYVREWGFVDVFRKHHAGEPRLYSFWDYRVPNAVRRKMGWRLDHIWASASLASACVDCWIDIAPRLLEKPSDHTFIVADFQSPDCGSAAS